MHPGQLAAEAAAGSVWEAVRAGDACLEEVAAIAPEKFVLHVQPQLYSSQPRKGGQGQGKGLRHTRASYCTKPEGQGQGQAEASEPMEVSEDTAESTDEEMEEGHE
eukprot:445444-Pelagomonas_calceolata.AAC.1